ncbi:MAG TPA: FeoC-like transcriptional regulator [Candidatus Bathyarchaeia archaeon]|nr:FeoC-like transcriptional regulator [Candidatus Bathyarchaeia archaeon]
MLSKLLAYLRAGGDANIATVSRKLDIEEGTVVMLFDQLVKMGYIEEVETKSKVKLDYCTTSKCAGCSKITACEDFYIIKYKLVK